MEGKERGRREEMIFCSCDSPSVQRVAADGASGADWDRVTSLMQDCG